MGENNLTELARRFAQATREKRQAQELIRVLDAELTELQGRLLGSAGEPGLMRKAGVSRITVDGMTVHVRRELWARAAPGREEEACRALAECGLGVYASPAVRTSSLSAFVREVVGVNSPDEADLPEPFKVGLLVISEVFKLGVTGATPSPGNRDERGEDGQDGG